MTGEKRRAVDALRVRCKPITEKSNALVVCRLWVEAVGTALDKSKLLVDCLNLLSRHAIRQIISCLKFSSKIVTTRG